MDTIQRLSYLIQIAEILFLCRRSRSSATMAVVFMYIVLVAIIAVDRSCILPKSVGYFVSFLVALHYVFIITVSLYIAAWVVLHRSISDIMYNIQAPVLIVSLILVLYGFINGLIVRTSYYEVETDKVDSGLRVVQISDLHLSNIYDHVEISRLVNRINNLEPDIVCVTGDIFTNRLSINVDMSSVYSEFRKIKATYGVYVIQGNHDVGLMLQLKELCEESRFKLLEDEKVSVGGIDIIGRLCSPGGDQLKSIGVDRDNFTVVLDHIPERIDEGVESGTDIILCGHTHGGQINIIRALSKIKYGINAGSKYYDDTLVIVNQGAYLIYPYCRIVGKSEIVCIDIK